MGLLQQRILIGMDASERSFHTVRYISQIESFKRGEVVLLNVYSQVPEAYWDLQKMPQYRRRLGEISAWEMQEKRASDKNLQDARRVLLDAGFSDRAVILKSARRQRGIARDIIREAKQGYTAVAVGRRGAGMIEQIILGSVATKLLQKVDFAPLFLVGIKASPERLLVAMDESENACRLVDYISDNLTETAFGVTLVHVIRGTDAEHTAAAMKAIDPVFEAAVARLKKAGLGSDRVKTKIIKGVPSRAAAIVDEARESGFSTILVGRRGLSKVREFFMGRVSNKVIYLAKGLAVWVIS
jgi:nucleotide-binding universal stress UspA family protein